MTVQNNKPELPAGFTDITKRVTSTMAHRYSKMKIEDDAGNITFESIAFALEAQKAVDHILRHVVKHNGDYIGWPILVFNLQNRLLHLLLRHFL